MTLKESKTILTAGNAVISKYDAEATRLMILGKYGDASEQMSLALGAAACLAAVIHALADSMVEHVASDTKMSDCCGASPDGIAGAEDVGICPDCHEHCEWIKEGGGEA